MSTSLLFHAWGIQGYHYVRTGYDEGEITFTVEQNPNTIECSHCKSRRTMQQGHATRRFKTIPVGGKPVTIKLPIPDYGVPIAARPAKRRWPLLTSDAATLGLLSATRWSCAGR